jgi:subtilisin family serine protease
MTSFPLFSAEYIVKFKSAEGIKSFKTHKSVQGMKDLKLSFGHFAKFKVDNKSSINFLKSDSQVEYVEENHAVHAYPVEEGILKSINDPSFSKQWGLKNTGTNSGGYWLPGKAGEDINALEAWKVTKGDKAIKIAVIDTGVDYNHIDLKDNIMINEAELNGEEGVDDDENGYIDDVYGYDFANDDADPMDGHGHGTHCAGVIGASHDEAGIAGVMADVQILSIKFLKDSGSGTTEGALKSIDYAIKRGVHVMSNSWGGGPFNQALFDAIKAADEAGIVFVAAAGNSRRNNNSSASYPANYEVDNIISVGAMDGAGKKASFSNYGSEKVHVFAPGVNIYSTVQNNGYKKMSGTSMACPHVSGVVGLLLAQDINLTPLQVRDILIENSVQTTNLNSYSLSKGRVDAFKALEN